MITATLLAGTGIVEEQVAIAPEQEEL